MATKDKRQEWEKKTLTPTPVIQDILDNIDDALVGWDNTKAEHNLGPEIIAEGNAILKEIRNG